jgi:hypothetical protein
MTSGDSLVAEQLSFQIADGGSIPTSSLQFLINPITNETATLWVRKWHYSHRIPTGKNMGYGLYSSGSLYAVIVYGIGVNPFEAGFLRCKQVVEIKRMCRSEPKQDYELSRFIRLTMRMLAREYPHDCVIAFADPMHGHEGIVYKASGFKLEGMTNPEWHLQDSQGEIRHRRFAFRYARRNKVDIQTARQKLGVLRIRTEPKFRWVLRK